MTTEEGNFKEKDTAGDNYLDDKHFESRDQFVQNLKLKRKNKKGIPKKIAHTYTKGPVAVRREKTVTKL